MPMMNAKAPGLGGGETNSSPVPQYFGGGVFGPSSSSQSQQGGATPGSVVPNGTGSSSFGGAINNTTATTNANNPTNPYTNSTANPWSTTPSSTATTGSGANTTPTTGAVYQPNIQFQDQARQTWMDSPTYNPNGANTWAIQNGQVGDLNNAFGGALNIPQPPANNSQPAGQGSPIPGQLNYSTPAGVKAPTQAQLAAYTSNANGQYNELGGPLSTFQPQWQTLANGDQIYNTSGGVETGNGGTESGGMGISELTAMAAAGSTFAQQALAQYHGGGEGAKTPTTTAPPPATTAPPPGTFAPANTITYPGQDTFPGQTPASAAFNNPGATQQMQVWNTGSAGSRYQMAQNPAMFTQISQNPTAYGFQSLRQFQLWMSNMASATKGVTPPPPSGNTGGLNTYAQPTS